MAGLAGHAFTTGGVTAAMLAFVAAAAVIVALMFGLSFAVAGAQERVVETLRARAPQVKRWGGRILVLVGAWLISLGVLADAFSRVFPV
jgi:hypothetical protein